MCARARCRCFPRSFSLSLPLSVSLSLSLSLSLLTRRCSFREQVPNGHEMRLPFWLAKVLKGKSAVDMKLPRHFEYKGRFRQQLALDPSRMNLKEKDPRCEFLRPLLLVRLSLALCLLRLLMNLLSFFVPSPRPAPS